MEEIRTVGVGPLKELLRQVAPSKAHELDALFDRLSPMWLFERSSERILFQADSAHNIIRVGTKAPRTCSRCRRHLDGHQLNGA